MLVLKQDTREQKPLNLSRFPDVLVISEKLDVGDYSLAGFEDHVAVEWKAWGDFFGSITKGRDRLSREMRRAAKYDVFVVVVEGTKEQIEKHYYRSKVTPESVKQTVRSWEMKYNVKFIFTGTREAAEEEIYHRLRLYAEWMEKKVLKLRRAEKKAMKGMPNEG